MPLAHRDTDKRNCDALTIVEGQSSVFVNGKLWAVKDDKNTHGEGGLINTAGNSVFINGKPVIVKGDLAHSDEEGHENNDDAASGSSSNVAAYGV